MPSITYEVVGLDPLVAKLQGGSRLMGQPLRKALTTGALLVEGEAKRLVPVDTGNLRRTITHRVDRSAIPLFAEIGTNAPYAQVVHDGRRAGATAPPTSALAGWAGRHGIPRSALFVLARAIGRRGSRGRPFLRNAFAATRGRIEAAFSQAAREIEANFGGR